MKSNESLRTLQAGRAFAACSVVLFHTGGVIALPKYFGVDPAPWAHAGDSGVPFFFVLSGLIMMLAHGGDGMSRQSALLFCWRRFRRIYPVLWAALLVSIVGNQALAGGQWSLPAWEIVKAFLIVPSRPEPLLAVEWTLRHEVIFYLLFAILLANARLGIALMGVFFTAAAIGVFVTYPFPLGFWTSPYNLLFLMGILAGGLLLRLTPSLRWSAAATIVGAGIFLAGWIGAVVEAPFMKAPGSVLVFGVGASLIMIGLVGLERAGRVRTPDVLVVLGDASYSIYLIHFLAASALTKVAVRVDDIVSLSPVLWFIIVAGGSVAAGMVFYYLVERPLLARLPPRPTLRPVAAPAQI
ncbi:MAG: acyltransferase [Alphaproteobacteria bacterium]|nr:acyltransferase [Alphaproteobacteria bacterium]MBU2378315.1 acyltransferase [Alphaproteobacteria bacterium]